MTVDTLYQLFEKSIRLFMVGVGDKLEEEIRVDIMRRSHRRRYSFDDVFSREAEVILRPYEDCPQAYNRVAEMV